MKRKLGFTLIELLVVIAIISILAAIVVPNVNNWIARARMTNTVAEVQGIELALTQMLNDAQRQNARQIFSEFPTPQELAGVDESPDDPPLYYNVLPSVMDRMQAMGYSVFEAEVELYTQAFYILLRQGRNAVNAQNYLPLTISGGTGDLDDDIEMLVRIDPNVRGNLGTSYMDVGTDPWDNRYRIWPGPWSRELERTYGPVEEGGIGFFQRDSEYHGDARNRVAIPFRSFREGVEYDDGSFEPYQYTTLRRREAEQRVPGNPPVDGRFGFPAPTDQQFFVYSRGADGVSNQNYRLREQGNSGSYGHVFEDYVFDVPMDIERVGGGDDINNWDNQQGWSRWYTN